MGVRTVSTALAVVALASAGSATAATSRSPLLPFLARTGEVTGFRAGKPYVATSFTALAGHFHEEGKASREQAEFYEEEGFAEEAIELLRGEAGSEAEGLSAATEFGSAADAKAVMRAQLKVDLDSKSVGPNIEIRRFAVPRMDDAVGFEFAGRISKHRAAAADVLLVRGSCLLAVGVSNPSGQGVRKAVVAGVQAIRRRNGRGCP